MKPIRDTIAAIATPPGEGGIGVIRISGGDSLSLALRLFRPAREIAERDMVPRRVYFGRVHDPRTGEGIDEALLTWFRAPGSYTREDVVEISVHGGVYITSRILRLVLDAGARLAAPGEFTRRAFLNGRIDLSQAEAVADLIHAASDKALQSALAQLQGALSGKLTAFYDNLMSVLAQLETTIDFPEEGLEFQQKTELLDQVRRVRESLEALIQSYRQGKIFREGARVALAGKPNVGKSSLLNTLLQEDRAIVTPFPGTTRDVLEEQVRIKDIHINIIDSAGLRADPEPVEEQGIARTRAALAQADLALVLFDGSQALDANDEILIREVKDKPCLIIINKCDLPEKLDVKQLQARLAEPIRISAKTPSGIHALIDEIHHRLVKTGTPPRESTVITRERHRELLVRAHQALLKTCRSIEEGLSEEFIAEDINDAVEALGMILGKTIEEDLLDKIFSEFCIGK
ncbi:MAG: tRNA uridine-5-carboxymethylaminomethyl(34) synthesis GTPase MnmE [Nitrospinales bacterium]